MGKADWSSKTLGLLVVVMLGSSFSEGCILNKCELKSRLQIASLESEVIAKLVCTVEYTSLFNTSHVRSVKNFNPELFNRPRPFFGSGTPSVIGDYFPSWPTAEIRMTNSPPDLVTEDDYIPVSPEQDPWFPVEGSGDQSEVGREEPSLDGLDDKPKRKGKRHAEEELGDQSEELSGEGPGQGSSEELSGDGLGQGSSEELSGDGLGQGSSEELSGDGDGLGQGSSEELSGDGLGQGSSEELLVSLVEVEVGEPEYFDGSGEGSEVNTEPPTPSPQTLSTVIYDYFEGHRENEQDSPRILNLLESPEPPTYPPHFDETFDYGSGEGSGVHFDTTPEPTTPPPTNMEIYYDSYEDLHQFNVVDGFGEGSGDTTPEPTTPPPQTEIHGDSYKDLYPEDYPEIGSGIPSENPEVTPEPTNPTPPTEKPIYYDNFEDLNPADTSRILYGIFQLNDLACRSESSDNLNICQVNCEDLLDDDIADDIECLKTLYPERMVFEENCHSVVPSEYFAECL